MHADGASRPTAGALRLVEARSVNPTCGDVGSYITAMFEHCPFLEASTARGMTGWTVYEVAPGAHRDAVEAELFYAGAQAAEWVRPLMSRRHGALACENIAIIGDAADADHGELMAWPHWALKHLYGPVGVMFGKFARGVHERDKSGRSIPPAPISFLPVRASVRSRDPRFLHDTPELAQSLAVAEDDGCDVFEHVPCDWKAVRAWAASLPVPRKR
ncbi:hypothetical protein E6P78_04050 [Streptomyces sp. A0958]|uniref:hypothetical protein n=1 Tax=Streptomyces sp. A0958 TaxID=2563101 RepID=UPI00109E4925|nr:hypothetical protein [Streptomyces sp. A0958]THA71783.1 hypothetical protein E6P78_04050 [Streptomyces sp. A0958]